MSNKVCPYCAEPITPATTVCPSCKEAVPQGDGQPAPAHTVKRMSTGMLVLCIVGGLCLLAVPFVAIVAAIAIPNLIEARKHGNEAAAIGALKTMNSAETLFREGDKDEDGTLDYGTLRDLSDTLLLDAVLGGGRKQGYVFTCEASSATPEFLWFATASPAVPRSTGDRYFATNHSGVIYSSNIAPFPTGDPTCELPGKNAPSDAAPVGYGRRP